MENTVITQPQGSNKKKLLIGGVVAVALVGLGIFVYSSNSKTLFKGSCVPGSPCDISGLSLRAPGEIDLSVVDRGQLSPGVIQPPAISPPASDEPDQAALDAAAEQAAQDAAAADQQGEQALDEQAADTPDVIGEAEGQVSLPPAFMGDALPVVVEQDAAEGGAAQNPESPLGNLVVRPKLDDIFPSQLPRPAGDQPVVHSFGDPISGALPGAGSAATPVSTGLAGTIPGTKTPAADGTKLTISGAALKNAPVIVNPNLKVGATPAVTPAAQPQVVVDNYNAGGYPEQPETLRRIKELEDALAAQDRARAAASAYGDNNNQLTPEQSAQQAAEARVAQGDAMRAALANPPANSADAGSRTLKGGVIDADAIAQAEGAQATADANNSADTGTVTRTARVSASNNAAAASRLHGAAIQGTSGPEVLFYPVIVALANGAYFTFRRRKNLK